MYWYEDSYPNGAPDVSAESCPKDSAQLEAVKDLIKEISWENRPISKLMELSDKESKEKFHNHTQKLRQDGLHTQLRSLPRSLLPTSMLPPQPLRV